MQSILDDVPPVMRLLALVLLGILTAVAILDFVFELRRTDSIGQRLNTWAHHYPLYALGLLIVLGALIAHFTWQPP